MGSVRRSVVPAFVLAFIVVILGCTAGAVSAQGGVSTGDGGWVWQNPTPTGNSYSDVSFVDSLRGWAVGDFGTVMHTFNGGITWYRQHAVSSAQLLGVDFADAGNGWAVGYDGTVMHTSNGGDSWELQDTGLVTTYLAVAATDVQHAWIIPANGTVVVSTSDGGQTWNVTDLSALLGYQGVHDLAFADALHGWISTADFGTVLHTSDGGASWQAQDSGRFDVSDAGMTSIACADSRRACVVMEKRSIFTNDGGATWSAGDSASLSGWSGSAADVTMCSDGAGWAVSWDGMIIRTGDGGRHWTKQRPATPGVAYQSIACSDSQHAWTVGAGGAIVATADAGATWKKQSRGDLHTPVSSMFMSIDFLDDGQHGWATCDTIVRTSNGGATWTAGAAGAIPIPEYFWLNDVAFTDAANGCAVSEGGQIVRSTDGGVTWGLTDTPLITTPMRSLVFADQQHGWAVGDQGVILCTSDGGSSWSLQPSGSGSQYFLDVEFVDAQTGWIVGGYPDALLHTTDGGASWQAQDLGGIDLAPTAVDFVDADEGWIACGGGQSGLEFPLLHTSDGGQTWTAKYLGLGLAVGMSDIAFADPLHGWAVGYMGTIVNTVDGGQSWTLQPSGTQNWLASVAVTDQYNAWTAGDLFTLLRTANGGQPLPDALPPDTVVEGDTGDVWQDEPVELVLEADDVLPPEGVSSVSAPAMSSGVQVSSWALDPTAKDPSRYRWRATKTLTVNAQGSHRIAYRSIDNAGNVEATGVVSVKVDTRRPTPKAPQPAAVRQGGTATLRFSVQDPRPGSPSCTVTVVVKNSMGVRMATVRLPDRKVNTGLSCQVRCAWRKGTYRFVIYARDAAGNPQTRTAANTLTVK